MIIPVQRVELDRLEIPEEESEIAKLANRLRSKVGTAYKPVVSVRDKEGRLLVEDPADQRIVRALRLLARSASSPEEKAKYAEVATRHNGLWHPDLEDFPQGTSLHSWEGGWEVVDREGRILAHGGKPRPLPPVRLAASPVSPDDD